MASTQSAPVPTGSPVADAPVPDEPAKRRSAFRVDRYATLLFFALFFVVVGISKGSAFLSWDNFSLVLADNANVAILAAAATITLVAGQFDLSVGAVAGLSSVLASHFVIEAGTPPLVTVLLILALGVAAGLLNAFLVAVANVNAFVATLGTGGLFSGVALWVSGGESIFGEMPKSFTDAGTTSLAGVPLPIVFVIAIGLGLWTLTRRTVVGRFWYAVGANPEASGLAGVRVRRVTTYAFIATSVLAALAGLLASARFGSADPAAGPDLLLPAFAGAFLGSAILSDGRFTVVGSLLAASLIVLATNGLDVMGVNFAVKPMFNGAVLVGAVALTEYLRRRSGRRSLIPKAT
ncbi:ABC transporter permease [Patulibacter sp. NPDC049589]|uniref:ABC transporter permease n=1 Tax=Patulibacter sp. NPDC049589 TaxID=3154731 RepID=UPI00342BC60F